MLYSIDGFVLGAAKLSAGLGFAALYFYFVGLVCWAMYESVSNWNAKRKEIARLRIQKLEQDKTMPVCRKWGTDACDRQGCSILGYCVDQREAAARNKGA